MARLVIAHGSPAARLFPLSGDIVTIGRNADNDIVVDDPSVSRFHANISQRDGVFVLRDLNSSAGTHIAGRGRVSEAAIRHNDRIRVGDTELVFELDEADAAAEGADVRPVASAPATVVSVRVADGALEESAIAFRVPVPESASTGQLSGRRADMLTRVAEALQWVTDLDDVLETLLNVVFELFQPDRGVILLKDQGSGSLVPRVSRPAGQELVISRTIVQYGLDHRVSVMVRQTAGDERFRHAKSVLAQSIRAAICCPLICRGKDLGALYVDTQVSPLRFNQEDLALFNLVAANAAIAIDNAILLQDARGAGRMAGDGPGPFFANSPAMKEVQARILEVRRGRGPVLVFGEPGSGKLAAAMWIHRACHDANAPFFAIDCATLAPSEARSVLLGVDREAGPDDRPRRLGLGGGDGRGAVDLSRGGTLVLEHVDALDLALQDVLVRRLSSPADETVPEGACVQLVATTSGNPGDLAAAERLHQALARLPAANMLEMPPLRRRREDVVPLANYLLSKADRKSGAPAKRLNASAESALRKLQFRHANAAELKEAIDLAALVADGPEIGAEHVFTGPKCQERRAEYDLAGSAFVRALVAGRTGRIAPALILSLFGAITVTSLVWRDTMAGQVANGLVWGLWWPALIVAFLLVGRIWCPFCPISLAGRIAVRAFRLGRKPPAWMKKHTGAAMTVLFLAIIWSERVFHMPQTPAATGVFLLVLASVPAALYIVYEREVWCRYLCPLGALAAGYAVPSPVVVHANPTVCASQCTTHDCSKGSDREQGCPVFLHPLYVRDSHFCKLCFSCLRSCQHQSAKIYARLPFLDIWKRAELSATLIPFATITFFVALVMLASQNGAWGTSNAGGFTLAIVLAIGAGIGLGALLPKLLCREEDRSPAARVAFALLVMAWGPLMAFHLGNIPGLPTLAIHAAEGSYLSQHFPALDLPLLGMAQLTVVAFSTTLALASLARIRRHLDTGVGQSAAWRWAAIGLLCAAYLGVASALVVIRQAGA